MRLTKFNDVTSFMELAEPLLQDDEPSSTMMYGVCRELQERAGGNAAPWSRGHAALTVEAGGAVVAAAVQTPPYGMIVHVGETLSGAVRDAALKKILDGWQRHGLEPGNVLAPREVAETLANRWARRRRLACKPRLRMLLYELTAVTPPRPCAGGLRRATRRDQSLVRDWFDAFHREALGVDPGAAAETMARDKIRDGEIYLWQAEHPVAMAARLRATATSASVGYVYTPPEARGRGVAANCVAALSQELLEEGFKRCTLFTDLENSVSNRMYQRLGYRQLTPFYEMTFQAA